MVESQLSSATRMSKHAHQFGSKHLISGRVPGPDWGTMHSATPLRSSRSPATTPSWDTAVVMWVVPAGSRRWPVHSISRQTLSFVTKSTARGKIYSSAAGDDLVFAESDIPCVPNASSRLPWEFLSFRSREKDLRVVDQTGGTK